MISPQTKISLFSFLLFNVLCSTLATQRIEEGEDGNLIEEWRLASATYVKENQLSSLTDGACGYGDLDEAGYGRDTTGLSSALFGRGSSCGACFEIRCVDHIHWCLQVWFDRISVKFSLVPVLGAGYPYIQLEKEI